MVFSRWLLAFCLRRYPPSDAEDHVLVLQDPGVQHGQAEIIVDDARCHQWLTNQIAEAPDRCITRDSVCIAAVAAPRAGGGDISRRPHYRPHKLLQKH